MYFFLFSPHTIMEQDFSFFPHFSSPLSDIEQFCIRWDVYSPVDKTNSGA